MSSAIGQNSLTPYGKQNSLSPRGNNNLNFRLARDQSVHLETAANLFVSCPDVIKPSKSGNDFNGIHFTFKNWDLLLTKTNQINVKTSSF